MAETNEVPDSSADKTSATVADRRLYLTDAESWRPAIKHGSERQYCYTQNPGEDYFHLILDGEIFLSNGDEQVCLNCALRRGLITADRLHWQHRGRAPAPRY